MTTPPIATTNTASPAGFDNYAELFQDPKVALSLGNTLFYAVMAVPLEIIFALLLAMLLNWVGRGAGVFVADPTRPGRGVDGPAPPGAS